MDNKPKTKTASKNTPPTAAEKATKREERKSFQKRKAALLEREKNNYGYVAFVKATSDYYICVGHSAVILARKIAKTVGLRFQLKVDRDFGKKSKEGVITIMKRDYYRERLSLSPYLTLFKDDENYLIFKLDRDLTPEEYLELESEEKTMRGELKKSVMKSVAMPKISNRLLATLQTAYRFYRKNSDTCSREFVLDAFCKDLRTAHRVFVQVCRSEVEKVNGLEAIDTTLSLALCDLVQISELKIWKGEDCSLLGVELVEIQTLVKNQLTKEKEREKEK